MLKICYTILEYPYFTNRPKKFTYSARHCKYHLSSFLHHSIYFTVRLDIEMSDDDKVFETEDYSKFSANSATNFALRANQGVA